MQTQSHPHQNHQYLPEVKRFTSYYSLCLYYQKQVPEESRAMKDKLNTIYQDILLEQDPTNHTHLIELFNILLENIRNHELLASLWKATIKTLIKLLTYDQVTNILNQSPEFDTQQMVMSLIEAKFETIDMSEEEQMLVLIQKALIKIVKTLKLNDDYLFKVFEYFMLVLKEKSINDVDSNYSIQFGDLTKKNLHKILYHFMGLEKDHEIKSLIFTYFFRKIKKSMKKLEKKPSNSNKLREYICFAIKGLEDCLRKIDSEEELVQIIMNLKDALVEVICITAEFDDVMIRNQAQQLFMFLLTSILDNNIPIREELEILLVKVTLKPAIQLAKKLGQQDLSKSNVSTDSNSKGTQGDGSQKENESDYENEDFIQINHERTQQEDLLLEMNMNYLLEVLLLLNPDQLSKLFLMYDCQPFSENFITKSLLMILKVAQKNPIQYLSVFNRIVTKLQQSDCADKINYKNNSGGPQTIQYMVEQKSTVKKLVKHANNKHKVFMQKIEDMYAYVDALTPAEVASKILIYSRDIQIDKIADIIGGKEEQHKKVVAAYLEKMDYKDIDIEQSLRRFLQTFRLAGLDSQVVLRILESFSHKFHELDKSGFFATKEEAYEFIYLIIVLQTCQHNPSVKNKTDLKSFVESAHLTCPKSKDTIPQNFFEQIYNSVTNNAFISPNSRSLIDESFNSYNMNEIAIRLSKTQDLDKEISESEFINSADLTQKQIFHYSNTTKLPQSLISQATKYLITFLTQRFMKYNLTLPSPTNNQQPINTESHQQTKKRFKVLKSLALLNKKFHNYDVVDKLFQVMYKAIHHLNEEDLHQQLESLLWDNFDCIKRSLVLLPKLSIQSFMKDDIKESLKQAFTSVMRLVILKHQEKKRLKNPYIKGTGHQHPPQAKSQSFFDLVYNYFTDNNEEENQDEKSEQSEREQVDLLRKRLLMEDKEENYMECIEEKFEEKTGQQWVKQKSRLNELITLVCAYVRENFNQEEGILCLAFLEHIISKMDNNLETVEKIWIELHLLMNQCLKPKQSDQLALTQQSLQKEERKGEYEVISTDTSQDSIDSTSHVQQELDLFVKESCLMRTKINEATMRHIILGLHIKISKRMIVLKQENQHVIRDVQRLISYIIEGELGDKNFENYALFDDLYLFKSLSNFIEINEQIKAYPKLSKLIRLMLILLLKSLTRKIENDEDNQQLTYYKMKFFSGITHAITENASSLPYDQITLSLEIFEKLQLPSTKSQQTQDILNFSIIIIENLALALQRQKLINDENKVDIWLKLIQMLQEKVLFNNATKRFEETIIQSSNSLKNIALNHPFEIEQKNYGLIKKLFADHLFWQTFENLSAELKKSQSGDASKNQEEQKVQTEENEDEDISENQLEEMCQICVNNLSDIFIYYISTFFIDATELHQILSTSEQTQDIDDNETAQKLFTYLWLNLLKVLLHYAEKANSKDFQGLIQSVHDNIKRVIEFLIQQGILREESENSEMAKLWKTSWEIVSAFFTGMKVQVLGVQQTIPEKKN